MNILIVDDDKYVLESIQNGINWDLLPFQQRYEARNGVAAMNIMKTVNIDVLLCDIEMPQLNGLELLEWIRAQNYHLEAIFLTSYAEFDYAQRALALGSFEYFLKPIEYDKLQILLANVAKKVSKTKKVQEFASYGEYWLEYDQSQKEDFWRKIISHRNKLSSDEICKEIERNKLPISFSDTFILVSFHIRTETSQSWRSVNQATYRLSNIIASCLSQNPVLQNTICLECIWADSLQLYCGILKLFNNDCSLKSNLYQLASDIYEATNKAFQEFTIYFSDPTALEECYEQNVKLQQMIFNTIFYDKGIFFLSDFKPITAREIKVDRKHVQMLLQKNDEKGLRAYINRQIANEISNQPLSFEVLQKFILDWQEIIFYYLHDNQIEANRLFANQKYKKLYEKADSTLEDCRDFIFYMVNQSLSYGEYIQESDAIVVSIKKFIQEHLSEELSRSRIAEITYLNPDYLAHLFKKSTGISLLKYINNTRLEKSKTLLKTTNIPVYQIAMQVGYPTSSYFAKQFKENYGISPNEYRNLHYRYE